MPLPNQRRTPTANPITQNQVLRRQARLNQQGQSPNVAAINVANLGQQSGGFAPQLQPVARAISQGTTVPQMREQNIVNQQGRANVALTQAQAGQVGGLNQTNLRIARQVPRAEQIRQTGQLATAGTVGAGNLAVQQEVGRVNLASQGLANKGAATIAGMQGDVQREGFASQERVSQAQAIGAALSNQANNQFQLAIEQMKQQGGATTASIEGLSKIFADPNLSLRDKIEAAEQSGLSNLPAIAQLRQLASLEGVSGGNGGVVDPVAPQVQQRSLGERIGAFVPDLLTKTIPQTLESVGQFGQDIGIGLVGGSRTPSMPRRLSAAELAAQEELNL